MVGDDPVVEDVDEESGGEDDDGHQVQQAWVLQDHLQSVRYGRVFL